MTTVCSWLGIEVHFYQHSTTQSEPPTEASLPPSDEGVQNQRSLDKWGHSMEKQLSTLKVMFQNIGGFSKEEEMEIKLEALQHIVIDWDTDIFGFTEANTCWDALPEEQRLAKCMLGWWANCQWGLTYNWMETSPHTNQAEQAFSA